MLPINQFAGFFPKSTLSHCRLGAQSTTVIFMPPIYHSVHPEELYHPSVASLKTAGKALDLW